MTVLFKDNKIILKSGTVLKKVDAETMAEIGTYTVPQDVSIDTLTTTFPYITSTPNSEEQLSDGAYFYAAKNDTSVSPYDFVAYAMYIEEEGQSMTVLDIGLMNNTVMPALTIASGVKYDSTSSTGMSLTDDAWGFDYPSISNITINGSNYLVEDTTARSGLTTKQDTLVSGTNIKTINNNSLLGSGNIEISEPTKISDLIDDTATTPIDKADTLTGLTASVGELNTLDGITATTTELNYCDGVTSNIQTQLDSSVHLTGNETIAGTKTFTGNIRLHNTSYEGGNGFLSQLSAGSLGIGLYDDNNVGWSDNYLLFTQNGNTDVTATTNVGLVGTIPATTNVTPTEDTTSSTQIDTVGARNTKLANYQPTLVSGTNIKTINNQTLLGSGNIEISSGGNAVIYEVHGTASATTTELALGVTLTGPNQVIGVNIGNTLLLPTLWSLNNAKTSIVLSNAIESGEMWSVVYVTNYSPSSLPIVTTLSSSSTDSQIPSAKCVYDLLGNVETLINAL